MKHLLISHNDLSSSSQQQLNTLRIHFLLPVLSHFTKYQCHLWNYCSVVIIYCYFAVRICSHYNRGCIVIGMKWEGELTGSFLLLTRTWITCIAENMLTNCITITYLSFALLWGHVIVNSGNKALQYPTSNIRYRPWRKVCRRSGTTDLIAGL